ncbi:12898_t:CDS:2 [Acaulospora morrowiae]|uniref:12898_t:CDS:1 n=1 Tax=Acaulospora morrowiae TaxID=94023 RepID=A0A9N9GBB5_9GLOM|nr:12898_t:CDS:2 [Acaulospora morrowiae]
MTSLPHVSVTISENEDDVDKSSVESTEPVDETNRGSNEELRDVAEHPESGQEREELLSGHPESGQEREGLLSGHPADELLQENPDKARNPLILRILMLLILLTVLVSSIYILVFFPKNNDGVTLPLLSNGTHDFHPTVILLSLDGFRYDYLTRNVTPYLTKFYQDGLQAKYLIPSFPSITFPNHYTIVTGLYPESHGIVGNSFYDPDLKDYFYYKDPKRSFDSKWWGGEPIWVTAVKQGQKSGVSQWVGSSSVIKGFMPTYHHPYDPNVTMDDQVSRVMNWLDLPFDERPTFISAYVSDVDSIGHSKGPDSVELNDILKSTDNMTRSLLDGLNRRNLTGIVNFIIVSDHGMIAINDSKVIYLEEIFNTSKIYPLDGYPLANIRPYDDSETSEIYLKLKNESLNKPWECFLRDEIPERYHFRKSHRISPILCIPLIPWAFSYHRNSTSKGLMGTHGYDNLESTMRGIFLASGPEFRAVARKSKTNVINGFYNVEVYNIIAKILRLTPAQNNGTVGGILWT